jgi:hypothetical protein
VFGRDTDPVQVSLSGLIIDHNAAINTATSMLQILLYLWIDYHGRHSITSILRPLSNRSSSYKKIPAIDPLISPVAS